MTHNYAELLYGHFNECLAFIKLMRDERDKIAKKEVERPYFTDKDFVDRGYQNAFHVGDFFLNDEFGSLRNFEEGYDEFMRDKNIPDFEKKTFYGKLISSLENNDNFWFWKKDRYTIDCCAFDEDSDYDHEFDKDGNWTKPQLESYRNRNLDDGKDTFFHYSFYINSTAERLATVINSFPKYFPRPEPQPKHRLADSKLKEIFNALCEEEFIEGEEVDFLAMCHLTGGKKSLKWILKNSRRNGIAKGALVEMISLLFQYSTSTADTVDRKKVRHIYNEYFDFDKEFEHDYFNRPNSVFYERLNTIING